MFLPPSTNGIRWVKLSYTPGSMSAVFDEPVRCRRRDWVLGLRWSSPPGWVTPQPRKLTLGPSLDAAPALRGSPRRHRALIEVVPLYPSLRPPFPMVHVDAMPDPTAP